MGVGMAAAGVGLGARKGSDKAARKPNIVFVLADDLGWRDVGFHGARFFETPNIDKLARDGMIFHQFYSGGPNCAPTRACIMTGHSCPRQS